MQHGFFSLPPEIRNQIYNLLWILDEAPPIKVEQSSSLAQALLLDIHTTEEPVVENDKVGARFAPLLVCRQLKAEAELFAMSRTAFHLTGKSALPDMFHSRISSLSTAQIRAIRVMTLTAKVTQLRAMNEAWEGLPFGHPCLRLDKLVIRPQKPDTSGSCYAEVADLSQCHTLAYVLAESLKSMKNVLQVEVQNDNCFKDFIWRLLYRCLVYRMYKWGGIQCGMKFLCSAAIMDGSGEEWFKIFIGDHTEGSEVGSETCRLMGKDGVDPSA